ncbi:DUF927 domain-containing protein [Mesorhizobium sp. M1148]|uniref:DUF927 domain-containing protein n=1 Tax=unclassified Mesorhizobium TaxID=325217 RepID=UPI003337E495
MNPRRKNDEKYVSAADDPGHGFKIIGEEIADNRVRHLTVRFPLQSHGFDEVRINRGLLFETQKAKVFFGNLGARLPDDCPSLFRYLQQQQPSESRRVTSQAGWHGNDFVTRFGTLCGEGHEPVYSFDSNSSGASEPSTAGTLRTFVSGIESFVASSEYVLLGMLLGLVPPLAARIGRKGGFTVALCGDGSTGKTLTIQIAHSLLAKAAEEADLVSFGDTVGATLDFLPAAGGTCLGFADIKGDTTLRDAIQKLRTMVFTGAAGKSRQRSTEAARPDPQFLVTFVSAERSLHDLFEGASLEFEKGEAVRALSIPVPADGGIFDNAIFASSAELARQLEAFLSKNYGTVLPRWIQQLVHVDKEKLARVVAFQERAFLDRVRFTSMPNHQGRIAKRFALLAAVGYVAIKARLLPTDMERLFDSVEALFWQTIFFISRADQLKAPLWTQFFRLVADEVALPKVRTGASPVTTCKIGFRRQEPGGLSIFLRREPLIATLTQQFVDRDLLPQLEAAGCITRSKNEFTRVVAQEGLGRKRYYVLDWERLLRLRRGMQL